MGSWRNDNLASEILSFRVIPCFNCQTRNFIMTCRISISESSKISSYQISNESLPAKLHFVSLTPESSLLTLSSWNRIVLSLALYSVAFYFVLVTTMQFYCSFIHISVQFCRRSCTSLLVTDQKVLPSLTSSVRDTRRFLLISLSVDTVL